MLEDGKIAAATPAFFGSNPAEVRQGPRRACARSPIATTGRCACSRRSTTASGRRPSSPTKAPGEIRAANTPQPPTDAAVGIAYGELNGDQQAMLRALFESYAEDMPDEVSRAWLGELRRAGFEAIRFAWAGPADRSQPHAYRVQGPTFLIEFNNTQNGANHIHSVWRNMLGDFGIPLAAR